MKIKTPIAIVLIIIAILVIGFVAFNAGKNSNVTKDVNQPVVEKTDKLFVAQTYVTDNTGMTNYFRAGIIDPSSNKLVSYREIEINPRMSIHSYNNGYKYVLFSPETQDVYYMAEGNLVYSDCGEGGCDPVCPKIGKCIQATVYKFNMNDMKPPVKIYDATDFTFTIPEVGTFGIAENNKLNYALATISDSGEYSADIKTGTLAIQDIKNQNIIKIPEQLTAHKLGGYDLLQWFK